MKKKSIDQFPFVRKIRKIKKVNLTSIVRNALREHERDILDLQKEQLSAGVADMGDEIRPRYARRTIRYKKKKGQPYDRVTLRDKGGFYRRMFIRFRARDKADFTISSSDRKRAKLEGRYHGQRGGHIFGLAPQNKLYLSRGILLPEIQRDFKDKIINAIK